MFFFFTKETYCEVLVKYKSDLARPFNEATVFLKNIETQLHNLCNDTSRTHASGLIYLIFNFILASDCLLCIGFHFIHLILLVSLELLLHGTFYDHKKATSHGERHLVRTLAWDVVQCSTPASNAENLIALNGSTRCPEHLYKLKLWFFLL